MNEIIRNLQDGKTILLEVSGQGRGPEIHWMIGCLKDVGSVMPHFRTPHNVTLKVQIAPAQSNVRAALQKAFSFGLEVRAA